MIDFPSEWDVRSLAEVVDILDSRRIPLNATERAERPGSVPYYGATGQVGWIDRPLFDEPLLLLGEDGVQFFEPVKQKAYLIDGPAWVNNHAHVLRAKPTIDRKFLNYWLNTADYRGLANGTTRLKLTQVAMKQIPVPLPPPAEQQRIVDVLEDHLSHLDAANAYLESSGCRLLAMERSILAESHSGPTRRLGELAVSAGYGTSEKCVADGPGVAVVRIPNLVSGRIDLRDEKRVAGPAVDVSGSMLSPGDLLIVRTNGSVDLIGRSAVVQDGVDAAFASYLIRYQLDREMARPEWVQAMLSAPQVRRKIEPLAASSAGQHNLSLAKLNPLEVPLPSLGDQDRGLKRLNDLRQTLSRTRAELEVGRGRAAALRRAVLAAAFSGRLTRNISELSEADRMMDAWPSTHAAPASVAAAAIGRGDRDEQAI